MATIAENLKKILSAVYGRDVRQAIHDSIKQCEDDVTEGVSQCRSEAEKATSTAGNAVQIAERTGQALQDVTAAPALAKELLAFCTATIQPDGVSDKAIWYFNPSGDSVDGIGKVVPLETSGNPVRIAWFAPVPGNRYLVTVNNKNRSYINQDHVPAVAKGHCMYDIAKAVGNPSWSQDNFYVDELIEYEPLIPGGNEYLLDFSQEKSLDAEYLFLTSIDDDGKGVKIEIKEITSRTAEKLSGEHRIDGAKFQGDVDVHHYGVCNSAASAQVKQVDIPHINMSYGTRIDVKFVNGNTADNPKLQLNTWTAYPITYKGNPIPASYIMEKSLLTLEYDLGGKWHVVGDLTQAQVDKMSGIPGRLDDLEDLAKAMLGKSYVCDSPADIQEKMLALEGTKSSDFHYQPLKVRFTNGNTAKGQLKLEITLYDGYVLGKPIEVKNLSSLKLDENLPEGSTVLLYYDNVEFIYKSIIISQLL